jgi:hypothetical protein
LRRAGINFAVQALHTLRGQERRLLAIYRQLFVALQKAIDVLRR